MWASPPQIYAKLAARVERIITCLVRAYRRSRCCSRAASRSAAERRCGRSSGLGQQQDHGPTLLATHRVGLGIQPALGASGAARAPLFSTGLRPSDLLGDRLRQSQSARDQTPHLPIQQKSARTRRRLQRTKRLYRVLRAILTGRIHATSLATRAFVCATGTLGGPRNSAAGTPRGLVY